MGDERQSLPGLVTQLAHQGVDLARAEVGVVRAKLVTRIIAVKSGAILLVAAIILVLLALIALTVGLMMALATVVGIGFAAIVTFLVLAIVAAAFAWLGVRQVSTKPEAVLEDTR